MSAITIDYADARSILAALGYSATEGLSHLPEIAEVHAAAQVAGDCSLAHIQRAQLLSEMARSRAEVAELREQLRLLEHTAKYQDYLLMHRAREPVAPPVDEEAAPARGEGRWRSISLASLDGAAPAPPDAIPCGAGLRGQNEPAEHKGMRGYWVQGDCVFIGHDSSPESAIHAYRMALARSEIGISHNHFCGSIRAKELGRAMHFLQAENAEMADMIARHGDILRRARDFIAESTETPRARRGAHEGVEARVRAAMGELIKSETTHCEERAAVLLSEALLLLVDPPPRFDFAGALFHRLIKSYEGTLVRSGVYRFELSLGNLRSAISIVEGDERAVWIKAAEHEGGTERCART